MRTSRLVIAIIAFLVGLLWLGQGLGMVGGSAMTGSTFWAFAGAGLVIVAAAIVLLERRSPAGG